MKKHKINFIKNMKKIIVIILAVIVLGFGFYQVSTTDSERDDILISANVPLSGDLAIYGEYFRDGSIMGYDELKDSYPTVPQIRFDWQDNQSSSKEAVNVFQAQKNSNPDIYVSGLKPQTMAIADLIKEEGIPHLAWILDTVINPSSENNFRVWVNFKKEAEVFVDYLSDKEAKKVYLIYPQIESAVNEYEGLIRPGLVALGIKNENIITEAYSLSRDDFSDIALKLKSDQPDYMIINGFIPHLTAMVKDFRTLDLIKDGNTLASLDMLDGQAIFSKEEMEGIVVAAPQFLINSNDPEIEAWKARFREKFEREPSYHDAYSYDSVKVILEAAENMSFPATQDEWIKQIKLVETEGITGEIKFDQDASSITPMFPAVYRSGELLPLN